MAFQYRFSHTCGHTGFGPIVQTAAISMSDECGQPLSFQPKIISLATCSETPIRTIHLHLLFSCPFCDPSVRNLLPEVQPGSGLLAILNSTPESPFPISWMTIKACNFLELKDQDWARSLEGGPYGSPFRQMAWVAKPGGRVMAIGGVQEIRREGTVHLVITREAKSVWRHRGDVHKIGYGRFAGLLTSLQKVVLEDERVERYA